MPTANTSFIVGIIYNKKQNLNARVENLKQTEWIGREGGMRPLLEKKKYN
jgi:hypothetical protein